MAAPLPPLEDAARRAGAVPAGGLAQRLLRWIGLPPLAGGDRFDDLARLARLCGGAYWEQDADGRYQRIDGAALAGEALAGALLGRTRWESAGRMLGHGIEAACEAPSNAGWEANRRACARREAFRDLIWALPLSGDRVALLRESGAPRHAPDGRFLGYAGVLSEIGAQVAHERTGAALRRALETAGTPSMRIESCQGGPGWRPVAVTRAACALLARTEADALAADPCEVLRTADETDAQSPAHAIGMALASGRALRRHALVIDAAGGTHPVELALDPAPGIAPAPAVLWLDPAPARAEALRARAEDLERALVERDAKLRELSSAARELELFSSAVSHDLRAPLRIVDGFATILKEDFAGVLGRFGLDHVERIIGATARMNQMIEALLKLARVSSGPIEPVPVDLSALSSSVVEDLRLHEPNRRMNVRITPDMRVLGDRTLLRIVLENLLANAWKYTSKTPEPQIEFDVRHEGGERVFCVADNGAGFDMRFADRLFRVFQRLHGASEFPGTGVGLATVSRIVRRHGGRIWAESAPGRGARFYFTLNEDSAAVEVRVRRRPPS